ncbi:hypothetical protein J6590_047600 [Homalodisca vitripennis]|nr:hypothetical protein J6590_047600 [Homalodisca vitripennis]
MLYVLQVLQMSGNTRGEQLTTLLDEDVLKKKIISSKKNTKPSTSSVADEANPSSSFSKGSYQWQRQDRLRSDKFQVVRREVVLVSLVYLIIDQYFSQYFILPLNDGKHRGKSVL